MRWAVIHTVLPTEAHNAPPERQDAPIIQTLLFLSGAWTRDSLCLLKAAKLSQNIKGEED